MKKCYRGITLFFALALAISAMGCGSSSRDFAATPAEYATESALDEALYDSKSFNNTVDSAGGTIEESASAETVTDSSRKLITTMSVSAETEDLDGVLAKVTSRVKELGGYIESSNIYNGSKYAGYVASRDANLTIRIPQDKLDSFISSVKDETNITDQSTNVEDVTLHYVDIESRKSALKSEEKRLLEIVGSAETVEDIIKVEERLSEVRYELESIESQLRTYDNRINYSTVYLTIEEVTRFTDTEPKGALQRMGEGFVESVEDVIAWFVEGFIWFVVHIPQIIVSALLILIVILIVRAIDKAGKKKKLARMQMMQEVTNFAPQSSQPVYQPNAQQTYQQNMVQSQNLTQTQNTAQNQNSESRDTENK